MKTFRSFWKWLGNRLRRRTISLRPTSGLHVECLEPRTVFSASIATMAADFGTPPPFVLQSEAVRESGLIAASLKSGFAGRHFEDGRLAYDAGHEAWKPDAFLSRQSQFANFRSTLRVSVLIVLVDRSGGTMPEVNASWAPPQPLFAQDGASVASQPPEAPLSQVIPALDVRPLPPPLRIALSPAIAGFALMPSPTPGQATSSSDITARDYAFQSYSPDDLLLALDLDDDSEDEEDLESETWSAEDKAEQLTLAVEIAERWRDDPDNLAFESLAHERAAIDAVLSELEDVESDSRTQQDSEEAVSAATARISAGTGAATLPFDADVEAGAPAAQAAIDPPSAGMVWLVPTGDANSSAWDLSGVFLGELPAATRGLVELETTLGVDQAFDVGTTEPLPTTAQIAPAAPPANGARPSVSADNQAARQSEQPS